MIGISRKEGQTILARRDRKARIVALKEARRFLARKTNLEPEAIVEIAKVFETYLLKGEADPQTD